MILVTGATGMTGANLTAQLLKRGDTVCATRRIGSDTSLLKRVLNLYFEHSDPYYEAIIWREGDLLDADFTAAVVAECQAIYHTAALVSFDPHDEKKLIENNIQITQNIVAAALKKPSLKLLHISSVASFGREKSGGVVTENTAWNGPEHSSNYSISKYESEKIVWDGIKKGLNAVIVNPSIILGVGVWEKGSAELFNTVWKGLIFYTPGQNGYIDVRDVARIMIKLMEHPVSNEQFLLNSENVTYKTLFFHIADALGKRRPFIKVTPFIAAVAWRVLAFASRFSKKRPIVTKETAHTSLQIHTYSSQKIEQFLDYSFIPIKECIDYTCHQFLEEHQS